MWRYIGVSFIIGLISSAVVFLLYRAGAFTGMAEGLFAFFESSNFLPEERLPRGPVDILQIAVFIGLSFGVAWMAIDIPRANLKLTVAACALFLVLSLAPTLALYGILFEPFSGGGAIVLSLVLGLIYSVTKQGQRKRLIHAVMGSRISSGAFNKILSASNGDAPLDARNREVTIVTCRVFNHPQMMQELEAADLVDLTNLFLKNTAEHLLTKGAYVDESSPHLVRAFFGIEPGTDHAAQACRAALELQTRLSNVDEECQRRWFQPLLYGIGVSSGEITMGIFGSRRDVYFSGVGDEIDFSRRLSGLNLLYGSRILISAKSFMLAKEDIEVRPMEMFYVQEEDVMTEVYELLEVSGRLSEGQKESRDAFWEGMIYLREGKYDSALAMFDQARISGKTDLPLEYCLARAEECLLHPERLVSVEERGAEPLSG